jgi:hypothetical protein
MVECATCGGRGPHVTRIGRGEGVSLGHHYPYPYYELLAGRALRCESGARRACLCALQSSCYRTDTPITYRFIQFLPTSHCLPTYLPTYLHTVVEGFVGVTTGTTGLPLARTGPRYGHWTGITTTPNKPSPDQQVSGDDGDWPPSPNLGTTVGNQRSFFPLWERRSLPTNSLETKHERKRARRADETVRVPQLHRIFDLSFSHCCRCRY